MKRIISNSCIVLAYLALNFAIPYFLPDWVSTGLILFLIGLLVLSVNLNNTQKKNEQEN